MEEKDVILEVKDISYFVREKKIIEDISFSLKRGGFYCVIGTNGSGKTTLLKSITNNIELSAGVVKVNGKSIKKYYPKQLAKEMSIVWQHNEFLFDFSAFQVVMMGRMPYQKLLQADSEKDLDIVQKAMEKTKKSLEVRLGKLNDRSKKDDVVTFEQLGVDRLFVDESQEFKNLFLYTKMRNVAGISQSESQRASDMFAKCRYMDEITGGKGITFATGTPISNSMTELYTNMRYLQYDRLMELGFKNFDAWASTFGETKTAIELTPEGTGYRAKTRFSKFYNLPELISIFKEAADIQTADMLHLPVPECDYENVVIQPSEFQKQIVKSLGQRAEYVRNASVDPAVDNMLKITNDGRKCALDQKLINPDLPENPNSKVKVCAVKAYEMWKDTEDIKAAQLVFCDSSTPKGDGSYNVYDALKGELVKLGVPEKEIAYIHDANSENKKAELFAKVRSGQIRFLFGSTKKMGAGTNVQERLIALHHLDVPWRPSDVGRILRTFKIKKNVEVTDNGKDNF